MGRTSLGEFFRAAGRAFFAVLAVLYTGLVGLGFYRSLPVRRIPGVLYESARLAPVSLFCIGTASAFGWLLAYHQIPRAVGKLLGKWTTSITATGLIVAAALLFIGCFIDAVPAMIILVLFLPRLIMPQYV